MQAPSAPLGLIRTESDSSSVKRQRASPVRGSVDSESSRSSASTSRPTNASKDAVALEAGTSMSNISARSTMDRHDARQDCASKLSSDSGTLGRETSSISTPRHNRTSSDDWSPATSHRPSTPNLESGFNSGAVTPATGAQTPNPLLDAREREENRSDLIRALRVGEEEEGPLYELGRRVSARDASVDGRGASFNAHLTSHVSATQQQDAHDQQVQEQVAGAQGVPDELGSLWREFVFVLVCSFGQLLFAINLGDITVNQTKLVKALDIDNSQSPWLVGSFQLVDGLSVILSGSLADLASPKKLMVGAFAWSTVWNVAGVFSISPERKILFFIVRAMQGLSVGVLVSASMSIFGRIYKPGMRKTRVFSGMAAAAPFGFWLGALQGGALSAHLEWIFGLNAILCGILTFAGQISIPPLRPAKDTATSDPPSMRNFDYIGAAISVAGCACLLFGLTQGSAANWSPYTYSLVIVGIVLLALFYFVEGRVARPLIPNRLWSTPGFTPLVFAYFLGFGAFVGAWQYYAVQFFLNVQQRSPLTVALYLTPNAIFGVLATFIVSKTLHIIDGHWILTMSMIAFALGPVFFLPQTPNTIYWALSMPGIALVTFGPDLSFAACSIFITSNVPRSYQGSAGSLLVTVQNLSAAVMTALADTVGVKTQEVIGTGESAGQTFIGLEGLKACWWFAFSLAMASAVITAVFVRIPKSVEKEHTT